MRLALQGRLGLVRRLTQLISCGFLERVKMGSREREGSKVQEEEEEKQSGVVRSMVGSSSKLSHSCSVPFLLQFCLSE